MKNLFKKAVTAVLAGAMVIGAMTFTAVADEDTFKVGIAGQFDAEFEGNFDEWADTTSYDKEFSYSADTQTFTADFGQKVKFSGNYVGFQTNVPVATDADGNVTNSAKLVSLKLDGKEIEIANDSLLTAEGYDNGVRINLTNQWNSDITTQPIAADVWATTEFQTIEISFVIEKPVIEDVAPAPSIDYSGAVAGVEYRAGIAGQFDTALAGNLDEWADTTGFDKTFTVGAGNQTYTADFGQKVKFTGNYVGFQTSVPAIVDAAGNILNKATLVSVKLDGNEVDVTGTILTAEGYDNGVRINITNLWNSNIETQPVADSVWATTEFQTIEIVFEISGEFEEAQEAPSTDEPAADEDVADPGFNAYFQAQTKAYTFRNNWDEPTYGFGTDDFNKVIWWNGDEKAYVDDVKITDALNISGNGVYYIVVEGWNDPSENGEWNMLGFSTDIPSGKGIEIAAKCYINGKTKYSEALTNAADDNAYIIAAFVNEYNDELKGQVDTLQPKAGSRIVMELTVTGMDTDNADAVEDKSIITGEAAADETQAPSTTEAPKADATGSAGVPVWVFILIGCVVVVVAVVVVVCVVVAKKKKNA